MTREEAIKLLTQYIDYDAETPDYYEMEKACKMAIKALEQEPCEDCISRQATVERLCKVAEFINEKRNGLGSPYVMAALFIQDNKDEFPSITPKPKTDVLDKIRAEISEIPTISFDNDVYKADILEIIDKYKAESEE